MGLAVVACSPKGDATQGEGAVAASPAKKVDAKKFLPSKAQKDSVSYLVGVNFGSFIKGYNFGDLNYAMIEKGMKDFVNAKGDPQDADFTKQFKVSPDLMNDLFNAYLEKMQGYAAAKNQAEGEAFLAANAKKAGVVTTESGLQYKIIEPGNDVKPSILDTVKVRYKGTLLDGTVFDEVPADVDPIEFTLNRVITGWQEGMGYIGEGGKATLYIPGNLGYGEAGTRGIEPNSVLIFDVELLEVHPFVATEEE